MSGRDVIDEKLMNLEVVNLEVPRGESPFVASSPLPMVLTGVLVGIIDDGRTPLVTFAGQPGSAALRARTVVDLQGQHIGQSVVLMLEGGDPDRLIVMGVIREAQSWPSMAQVAGQIDLEADGTRMIVTAKEQMVLRCGKASITLTKAGKILIEGTYVSTRSAGVNRIRGGSVQVN